MTIINEVKAFRTPDGKLFESKKQAQHHADREAMTERVRAWADKHCHYDMSARDVASVILEHRNDLLNILNPLMEDGV